MKKQYRKSDLNIITENNIKLITNRDKSLLDCDLGINTRENAELIYTISGEVLEDAKLKRHEKIQVIAKLTKIALNELKLLEFELSPNNIYVELDGTVKICERKISNLNSELRDEQLLHQLIGLTGFLLEGISYEQLIEVNSVQLESSKKLQGISDVKSLQEFESYITELLETEMNNLHQKQLVVAKSKYKKLTGNKLIYRLSLGVSVLIIVFLLGFVVPFKSTEVKLYEAYQNTDSTTILDIVNDVNIKRLSNNEKLIATKAVINDQVELNDEQKNNIIEGLSTKTNEKIFNYWLYIGKNEYDEANNQAIALSDADMQMYALLLLINEAQNNDDLDATERKELVDGYENQLNELNDKKTEVNGDQDE